EPVDVGALDEKGHVLKLEKRPLKAARAEFTIVVDTLPAKGGHRSAQQAHRSQARRQRDSGREMTQSKEWAIVTGASSGIGRELARQLSAGGRPVLAVARRAERLDELAAQARAAGAA